MIDTALEIAAISVCQRTKDMYVLVMKTALFWMDIPVPTVVI